MRTLAHAAQIVARSERPNASVLVDALHFSRSGGLPGTSGRSTPHCSGTPSSAMPSPDMPGPTDTPALICEARTGRLLPGEGALPMAELVATLPPDLPLAVEAPCQAIAALPALDRAKRAYQALSALVGA